MQELFLVNVSFLTHYSCLPLIIELLPSLVHAITAGKTEVKKGCIFLARGFKSTIFIHKNRLLDPK